MIFDTHIVVDWSARSKPSPARPSKDAIWYAVVRDGRPETPVYQRTRHAAITALADLLAAEVAAKRRVLIGFDFPFGYPAGVAKTICGSDSALDLWAWFADALSDNADNSCNRFEVASQINRLYPGVGPFWGRPTSWNHQDVPTTAKARHGNHPPEHRIADNRAKGAKTVWQLAYAGSVGSQVIVGLPALQRLRNDPRLKDHTAVWPFQSGLTCPDAPIVIAEIYPSLLQAQAHAARVQDETLDSAQVRVSAMAFAALDTAGKLGPLFHGPDDLSPQERKVIAREEAWILGLGHETALKEAA